MSYRCNCLVFRGGNSVHVLLTVWHWPVAMTEPSSCSVEGVELFIIHGLQAYLSQVFVVGIYKSLAFNVQLARVISYQGELFGCLSEGRPALSRELFSRLCLCIGLGWLHGLAGVRERGCMRRFDAITFLYFLFSTKS